MNKFHKIMEYEVKYVARRFKVKYADLLELCSLQIKEGFFLSDVSRENVKELNLDAPVTVTFMKKEEKR